MEMKVVTFENYDRTLLEGFGPIYKEAFPDKDEKEPYENILGRISVPGSKPGTAACLLTDAGDVTAGLLADRYEFRSKGVYDLELIYLAVRRDRRGQGLGRLLLTQGLEEMIKEIDALLPSRLRNIYFETEDPAKVKTSSVDPSRRLSFFRPLGARAVPVGYRQPPLDARGRWTDRLLLMVFPKPGESLGERLDADELKEFLTAFYMGLNVAEKERYDEFEREIDNVKNEDGTVKLQKF